MSPWLFYGKWIICIPGGLQSALASPHKEQQRPPDILVQSAWEVGLGEALLSYDVNTNVWKSSYTLPLSLFIAYYLSWVFYSLTPLRWLWHWEQGLSIDVSNWKDIPRAAAGGGGVKSKLSTTHHILSVPENPYTPEFGCALSCVGTISSSDLG